VEEIALQLPVLGSYSATAPFDCPKSKRILEQGLRGAGEASRQPELQGEPDFPFAERPGLVASGDPNFLPLVKKETAWAAEFSSMPCRLGITATSSVCWPNTRWPPGDESVCRGCGGWALRLPTARAWWARGSQVRHAGWPAAWLRDDERAGPSADDSLVLAREAGVKDAAIDLAIERSAKLLRFYIGKGCVPYGDHAPWMQTHDDNGKNGMAARAVHLWMTRKARPISRA